MWKEIISESINYSANNGKEFMKNAFSLLNELSIEYTGKKIVTPEEFHQNFRAHLSQEVVKIMHKFAPSGVIASEHTEPVSAYMNRAASLMELGNYSDSFLNYSRALELLRYEKNSEEAALLLSNLQIFLSKVFDNMGETKCKEYFNKAYAIWSDQSFF